MDVRRSSTQIAITIMDLVREGRIGMSRRSTAAIVHARHILIMDERLGVVCASELMDEAVPLMAHKAFEIGQIVRDLDDIGLVDLVESEQDMFAPHVAEGIAAGFGLVCVAKR